MTTKYRIYICLEKAGHNSWSFFGTIFGTGFQYFILSEERTDEYAGTFI